MKSHHILIDGKENRVVVIATLSQTFRKMTIEEFFGEIPDRGRKALTQLLAEMRQFKDKTVLLVSNVNCLDDFGPETIDVYKLNCLLKPIESTVGEKLQEYVNDKIFSGTFYLSATGNVFISDFVKLYAGEDELVHNEAATDYLQHIVSMLDMNFLKVKYNTIYAYHILYGWYRVEE